jgi:hypothetical protein
MEKLRGKKDHDACPRCRMSEDAPHVVRCQGTGTNAIFEAAASKVELTLGDKFTAPEIITAIGKRMHQTMTKTFKKRYYRPCYTIPALLSE